MMNLLAASLGLSIISVLASACALYIGQARLQIAVQRSALMGNKTDASLRKQLTDIIEKLMHFDADLVAPGAAPSAHLVEMLEDRQRFLLKRAEAIISKIADQVDPYEHLMLAGMLVSIDELSKAEKLFNLAIADSEAIDKSIACRGFARYLFLRGRCAAARDQYRAALDAVQGAEDHLRSRRGSLLERWAHDEAGWNNLDEARSMMSLAFEEASAIAHPRIREQETARLHHALQQLDARPIAGLVDSVRNPAGWRCRTDGPQTDIARQAPAVKRPTA